MSQLRDKTSESIHLIHPLTDVRWEQLVKKHVYGSVFHSPEWLEALRRTYGYEPVAFTTSAPGAELQNGIAFCYVDSWLTGRRLVSLPFSDHCDPLIDSSDHMLIFLSAIEQSLRQWKLRYIEMRPQ